MIAPFNSRLRQYAAGVVLCALLVSLVPWSRRTAPVPTANALARHDSLTHKEVATVATARRVAAQAQVKQTAAAVRVATLRAEADTAPDRLRDLVALQDTVIEWANTRAAQLEVALDASEIRAARTDSLLTVVRHARDDQCRILRAVPCPSRRTIVVVALLATTALSVRTTVLSFRTK